MADAAVEILLENLKQLLLQHAHLIPDAMNQVKRLEKTLVLVKHLELPQHWMRELIRRLRCLLYDAEDIVDTCANQANADSFLHDPIHGPSKIVDIVDEVEDVVKKFRNSYGHKRNKYGPIKSEYTRQDETEVLETLRCIKGRERHEEDEQKEALGAHDNRAMERWLGGAVQA